MQKNSFVLGELEEQVTPHVKSNDHSTVQSFGLLVIIIEKVGVFGNERG